MPELKFIDLSTPAKPKEEPCKGLIYRCRASQYLGSRGEVVERIAMVPLKRMSCPGCDKCGWLLDELTEYTPFIMPTLADDQMLFRLMVTNISHDYESGHVDDYDIGFEPVPK